MNKNNNKGEKKKARRKKNESSRAKCVRNKSILAQRAVQILKICSEIHFE